MCTSMNFMFAPCINNIRHFIVQQMHKQKTPWPLSASELYRESSRRRSAKLVPTFADRGVSRGRRNGSPTAVNLCFLDRSRYFLFK